MGRHVPEQHHEQPDGTEPARSATITTGGHRWRFVWSPGEEGRVIASALAMARRREPGLDASGVALLAQHVGRHLTADQTQFLGDLAGEPPPGDTPRVA